MSKCREFCELHADVLEYIYNLLPIQCALHLSSVNRQFRYCNHEYMQNRLRLAVCLSNPPFNVPALLNANKLCLENVELEEDQMRILSAGIATSALPNLTHLVLARLSLTESHKYTIMKGIATNKLPNLTHLVMRHLELNEDHIYTLSEGMRDDNVPHLTHIALTNNKISECGLCALFNAIRFLNSLLVLDVSGNAIKLEKMAHLSANLTKKLQEFHWSIL